jgi:hypothetical protein
MLAVSSKLLASICKAESRGQESAARFWALSGPSIKAEPRRRPKVCKRLHLKGSPYQYFYCIECGRCGAGERESSLRTWNSKSSIFFPSRIVSFLSYLYILSLGVLYGQQGPLCSTLQSCPGRGNILSAAVSYSCTKTNRTRTAQDYRRPPPRVLYHRLYHLLPHYFSLAGTRNKF